VNAVAGLQFSSDLSDYCLQVGWNAALLCDRCVMLTYELTKLSEEFGINLFGLTA
jgi:hypothetical protein